MLDSGRVSRNLLDRIDIGFFGGWGVVFFKDLKEENVGESVGDAYSCVHDFPPKEGIGIKCSHLLH